MTISLRLNNEDSELIKAYANMNGLTVSELLRRSVLEIVSTAILPVLDGGLRLTK